MDIVGPLPRTARGNAYILVVGDYFTKWVESYAIPDHTAQTVAERFVEEFVCRYGVPARVHTDQGADFESHLFKHICKLLDIKKTRTAPYRPCSDGFIERANRTIQQILAMLVNEARDNWDDHLPYVMMAYRATAQDSTKLTPNRLMLGREVSLPLDIMMGPPPEEGPRCPIEYVEWVRAASSQSFELARRNMKASAERQRRNYDANASLPCFRVGDWVWHFYPPRAKEKLGKPWRGPYLVVETVSDVNVRIQEQARSKSQVVHTDSLKLYQGSNTPVSWLDGDLPPNDPNPVPDALLPDEVEEVDVSTSGAAISAGGSPVLDPISPSNRYHRFDSPPEVESGADLTVPLATRRSSRPRKPPQRMDL